MSQVSLLYRLQQIDDEIREGKKRLTIVVRLQTESKELATARSRSETAASTLQQLRGGQTDLNLELKSLEEKANRSEDRMYSGLVKNPKELADLQHELDSLARRRSVLEDELLETMIMVEEQQEEYDTAAESLNQIQNKWESDQAALQEEQAELVQRINELIEMRENHLKLITPESLSAYEQTLKRTGETAVVTLRNGRCRGCQVTVPANLIKAVDEGHLVNCDSCTRILCPV